MYSKFGKKGMAAVSAACCLVLLLSACFVTASAEGVLFDDMILDLKAFDILQGDENGALNLDRELTRAEMSKIVAVVMQIDGVTYPKDYGVIYHDVPSDHWAFSYITMLSGLGLLNGNPDGNFYPDATVTGAEAMKILVHMMGFGIEATENGGYPGGYISTAARRGISSGAGAEPNTGLRRDQAMRMIYNCLDADRLVAVYGGKDGIVAEISSKTYRDLLMGDTDDGLAEIEGVVTANYESYLLDPVYDIEKNQVEIDGVIYEKGSTDAEKYLGMKVRAFVHLVNGSNRGIIKAIEPVEECKAIELSAEDVSEITYDTISYMPEDGKRVQKKNLARDMLVLYNGRPLEGNDLSKLDLDDMPDAKLKLISHQRSAEVNVAFVDVPEDFIVESVNAESKRLILADEKRFDNSKIISFDESDTDKIRILKNAKGEHIMPEDVEAGSVLTAYGSQDGTLGIFYVANEVISGSVTGLDQTAGEIQIGEETYAYRAGLDVENILGRDVSAKLNYLGQVSDLDFDLANTGEYGTIVNLKIEDGLNKALLAQVLRPGKIVEDEVEEGDDPEDQAVPMIEAQNSAVEDLTFSSKVIFNGNTINDAEKLLQAIQTAMNGKSYLVMRFKLNANGEIRKMDALEEHTVLQSTKQYNAYSKTFAGPGGAFGLGDETLAFCVPTNTVKSQRDYLARIEMNNKQNYMVSAFSYNEDTRCPDVVVFEASMVYDTAGITDDAKKIGLVESVVSSLDEDSLQRKEVVMATPNGTETFMISEDTSSTADFDALKPGDLIIYSLDSRNYMDGYNLLESCSPIPGDHNLTRNNFKIYSGKAIDAEYQVVSNNLNNWVDTVTMTGEGLNDTVFEVKRDNPPPIYIWDESRQNVTVGTTDDFLAKQEHTVVVQDNEGSMLVRAVVIII